MLYQTDEKSWQILRKDSSPISIPPPSPSPRDFTLCHSYWDCKRQNKPFAQCECNVTKFQISSKGGKLIVKFWFMAHLGIIYHTMTSSNVWIQPWSLSILLKECKCRIIPIKWSSFVFVLLNNNFSQTFKCIFFKIFIGTLWLPFFICLIYKIDSLTTFSSTSGDGSSIAL